MKKQLLEKKKQLVVKEKNSKTYTTYSIFSSRLDSERKAPFMCEKAKINQNWRNEGRAEPNALAIKKNEGVYRTRGSNCRWPVIPDLRAFQRARIVQEMKGMTINQIYKNTCKYILRSINITKYKTKYKKMQKYK